MDVESVLDLIIGRELYVNLYSNDLVWHSYFQELNSHINSADENESSFNYTYSKENGEYMYFQV